MAKKESFEHESIQDPETIQKYFQALIDGFENGRIVFTSSNRQVVLIPGELIGLEIKAKKKGDKNKISLKLSWRDDLVGTESASDNLDISA